MADKKLTDLRTDFAIDVVERDALVELTHDPSGSPVSGATTAEGMWRGPGVKEVSATTYTLVRGDAFMKLRFTHASGCDVTVPLASSVSFPATTAIMLWADTDGTVSVVVDSPGPQVDTAASFTASLAGENSQALLELTPVGDRWLLSGDLAAA